MILHVCTAAEWAEFGDQERYRAPSLGDVGFVHCSDPGTVHLPAGAYYRGRTDLLLLRIDPARLDVTLRWEPGDPPHPAGIWFPHVYGSIPRAAIVEVHEFPPEPDGSFVLPAALANR